jgi:hypothetical protein
MFMMVGKKKDARKRLADLEKRFDLKGLEKRLDKFETRELDKVLDKLDLKDLEKKLEKDVARRYQSLRHLGHREEPKASSAGFIAGLLVGVIVGIVLAIVFGKQNERSSMDRFVSDTGIGTAASGAEGSMSESPAEPGPAAEPFGDSVAIEREVNGDGDLVASTSDSVDVASNDVRNAADDVAADLNRPPGDR